MRCAHPNIPEDDISTARSTLARLSVAVLGAIAVAGVPQVAVAHTEETSQFVAALIDQARARTASAHARGASALEAVGRQPDELGTESAAHFDAAIWRDSAADINLRSPSASTVPAEMAAAARAAAAALHTVEQLPDAPKQVRLTAAAAKRAADKAAAEPTDVKLANFAAAAENAALAASTEAFGTTASKVEWVATYTVPER
ncbi:hypothetical protein [Nocardia tenerifensis]|uniref:hypothetical protein n=1 Tax=Nocardia tenerifensis TaxID=228006 RepID=UPI0002FAA71B|nr:hypothetical protein [Nocardia tenerifensis]